ncbi:MAG: DUF6675 family protein [Spirochaetota bacterium]
MRHRVAAIFAAFLLFTCGFQLVAVKADTDDQIAARVEQLLPGLTAAEVARLIIDGELSIPYGLEPGNEVSVRLAPAYARQIEGELRELDPAIGVEVLFLVDAPDVPDGITVELFRTMQSVSTMEGIEYYSASRDRMRTLFHESYVIKGPDDRTRLPDPEVDRVPRLDRLHIYQRDSSFGENVLDLTYTTSPEAARLSMRNLTQMYYLGFIPAVGPQQLALNLVVYPFGEKLLFYGNSAANPIALFGMEARVRRSFQNRLAALYRWFLEQWS